MTARVPGQAEMEAEIREWETDLHDAVLEMLRQWLPKVRAAVLDNQTSGVLLAAGEIDPATGEPVPPEEPAPILPPINPDGVGDTEAVWGNLLAAYLLYRIAKRWNDRVLRIWRHRDRPVRVVESPARAPMPGSALPPVILPTVPQPRPTAPGGSSRAGGPIVVPPAARPSRVPPTPPPVSPDSGSRDDGDEPIILFDPNNRDRQRQHLELVANRTRDLPDTVWRAITLEINRGIAAGEGPREMRDRIGQFLDMDSEGGFERWNRRAERIARTESTDAYNSAAMDAALDEEDVFGDVLHKSWMATLDARTRPAHRRADGQTVPLREDFHVGGEHISHPGRGSAANRVNCRCSMLILPAGDPLPDESDRQTERTRSDGSRRDPQAVVRQWEREGDIRDRDRTVTASAGGNTMRPQWSGILAPIGTPTSDGRIFTPGIELTTRELPLPLWWQHTTSEGHESAVIVGRILSVTVTDGAVTAAGEFFTTDEGRAAAALVADQVIRPSVDLLEMEWGMRDAQGREISEQQLLEAWDRGEDIETVMAVTAAVLAGATLVGKPAFADAKITINGDAEPQHGGLAELLASAGGTSWVPDAGAFADPQLSELTPLTVTADGRVFGHLAGFNTCHLAVRDACVLAPRSRTDYAFFHVSEIDTSDGALPVGKLTVGGGHATARAGVQAALAHYDNAGAAWAYVRAGEDQFGIWVSGVVHPDATEAQIREGASSPLSGDWRKVNGNLELVAALSVNTPGFPIVRGARDAGGREVSLVAAGAIPLRDPEAVGELSVAEIAAAAAVTAVREYQASEHRSRVAETLAQRLGADRASRAADLAARLTKEN